MERARIRMKAFILSFGTTKIRQCAGLKRVTFATQLTINDHNFGYVANRFLQHLGLSRTSASVLIKQRIDKQKVTPKKAPKKSKKKMKSTPGPDYQPGNF